MAPPSSSASVRDNAVGIVLVVGAVLVGLLLLAKGYDDEGGVTASASQSSEESTTTTAALPETTTTAPPTTNPPASVAVKVANASGLTGVASKVQTTLQGKGYSNVQISNAPSVVPSTQIYFVEGAQGDADAVAQALGLDAAAVQPMPAAPPVALNGATVLVLAGPNVA